MNTYPILRQLRIERTNSQNELIGLAINRLGGNHNINNVWQIINVTPLIRHGISGNGYIHLLRVSKTAVRIVRILAVSNIQMSITYLADYPHEYAELIVFLASLFHDYIKEKESIISLSSIERLLYDTLSFLPVDARSVVVSHVVHAISCCSDSCRTLTLEAGIVRLAEALDLRDGKLLIPKEKGYANNFLTEDSAIEEIAVSSGSSKPINIDITINHPAGLCQIEKLINLKIIDSKIEDYILLRVFYSVNGRKMLIEEYATASDDFLKGGDR